MRIFFDTSVLVAASVQQHPHPPEAHATVTRTLKDGHQTYISMHSVAEFYSSLTRLPVQPMVHPAEAARILEDNILPNFEAVPLELNDYRDVVAAISSG